MNKTALFLLVALLIVPPAFPILVKLRLERAATPDGDWIEVPAETLLVTPEGDLEDSFTSASAYYRMRVDHIDEEAPATAVPFEDVPATARAIAEAFLESSRDMGGRDGFGDAVLGPVAYLMYTPGIAGPSYVEFAALSPQPEPPDQPPLTEADPSRGYILVSLTQDDFPVVEFCTEGTTRTERLRSLAKSSSIQVFRYGNFLAGEDGNANLVARLGSPPVRFSQQALQYIGQEYEGYIADMPNEQVEDIPDAPDLSAQPYQSYQELKDDFANSPYMQLARQRRRQQASMAWEAYLGAQPRSIYVILGVQTIVFDNKKVTSYSLDNSELASVQVLNQGLSITGLKPGNTILHVEFSQGQKVDAPLVVSKEGALSPEQPLLGWTDWEHFWAGTETDQRPYDQVWGGSCASGCGATAWTMLYGWYDFLERCEDLIAGGRAPLTMDANVLDCLWDVVADIDTVCVLDQGFVWPHRMYDGRIWGRDHLCSYYVSWAHTSTCIVSGSARDIAIRAIRERDVPAIIGVNCEFHYCLAWGYRTRRWEGLFGETWWTDHFFCCNDGHGDRSPVWKNGWITWIGIDAGFAGFH